MLLVGEVVVRNDLLLTTRKLEGMTMFAILLALPAIDPGLQLLLLLLSPVCVASAIVSLRSR